MVARSAPRLDSVPSVFMFSFPKDLALVTVGPRVGRCYGDFVARNVATGWRPRYRARRRRVHRGRGAAGFPATGVWDSIGASTRGSTGLGSSLLATTTRLQIVALHSPSFPVVGGKPRSNCARARASAGVGGSETCTDRDALRLLTMSEGDLSRPRGRMPSSPAPQRAGRSSTSREWRSGLFPQRRLGSSA